jgi:hypothetical protein
MWEPPRPVTGIALVPPTTLRFLITLFTVFIWRSSWILKFSDIIRTKFDKHCSGRLKVYWPRNLALKICYEMFSFSWYIAVCDDACLLFIFHTACGSTPLRHKQGPHELTKWMDKARITRAHDYRYSACTGWNRNKCRESINRNFSVEMPEHCHVKCVHCR